MTWSPIDGRLAVSTQSAVADLPARSAEGGHAVISNRPDGEGGGQPALREIESAEGEGGMDAGYLPVEPGLVRDADARAGADAMRTLPGRIRACCRSAARSATLRALSETPGKTNAAGCDMSGVARRVANRGTTPPDTGDARHKVVIVGPPAAGISGVASLKTRKPTLQVTIIDPADSPVCNAGGATNATNARTAAALRKQPPTVAESIVADISGRSAAAQPDRYDSCPPTVERDKTVLPEVGHGGAPMPSLPSLLIDAAKPSRLAWVRKEGMPPPIPWQVMRRGRAWPAKPVQREMAAA